MFRRSALSLLLLVFAIGQRASAKCVYDPQIRADVSIEGCVGVTFSSSHSQTDAFAPVEPFTPLYKQGASYSGTFLLVTVRRSAFVSPEDRQDSSLDGWAAGDTKGLFVHGSPDEVCPLKLSRVLTVTTDPKCCDVVPWTEACLVPSTVPIVTVTRLPAESR